MRIGFPYHLKKIARRYALWSCGVQGIVAGAVPPKSIGSGIGCGGTWVVLRYTRIGPKSASEQAAVGGSGWVGPVSGPRSPERPQSPATGRARTLHPPPPPQRPEAPKSLVDGASGLVDGASGLVEGAFGLVEGASTRPFGASGRAGRASTRPFGVSGLVDGASTRPFALSTRPEALPGGRLQHRRPSPGSSRSGGGGRGVGCCREDRKRSRLRRKSFNTPKPPEGSPPQPSNPRPPPYKQASRIPSVWMRAPIDADEERHWDGWALG